VADLWTSGADDDKGLGTAPSSAAVADLWTSGADDDEGLGTANSRDILLVTVLFVVTATTSSDILLSQRTIS